MHVCLSRLDSSHSGPRYYDCHGVPPICTVRHTKGAQTPQGRRGHTILYTAKFKPCAKNSNNNYLYTKYTAIVHEVTKYSNILLPRWNFAVYRAYMRVACPLLPWGVYAPLDIHSKFLNNVVSQGTVVSSRHNYGKHCSEFAPTQDAPAPVARKHFIAALYILVDMAASTNEC